jgi:hypothetical protein
MAVRNDSTLTRCYTTLESEISTKGACDAYFSIPRILTENLFSDAVMASPWFVMRQSLLTLTFVDPLP